MSLKYDSQKKIRKRRSKWKVDTVEEFEDREYQLLKDSMRYNVQTVIGQVRITAGSAKNIKLDIPRKTRPLTDRMKTQIFDTLTRDIIGKKVLDLYAGSGSFGLEALSRGAESAVFVDASKHAERIIRDNIAKTGFQSSSEVVKSKTHEYLNMCIEEGIKYEIIFIDPPYKDFNKKKRTKIELLLNLTFELLPGKSADFPGALIVKHPRTYPIDEMVIEGMKILETNTYGMNAVTIIIFETET